MPNNAILLVGLGLAAFTLFRREEGEVEETNLVDASMLASGTGDTGKILGVIPTITSDDITALTPAVIPVSDADTELLNVPLGPEPKIAVTPFVQTPVVIATLGPQAGEPIRQLGLTTAPDEIVLANPKIYVEQIPGEYGEDEFTSITMTEGVQIVPGGANFGGAYFSDLATIQIARDQGYFDTVTYANEFNVQSAIETLAVVTAPPVPVEAGGTDMRVRLDDWWGRQSVDLDIGI